MSNIILKNRIKVFRAEYNLNQSELAEKIGVTRKTISAIETGRFVPSTIIALKLAHLFQVSAEEVFSLAYE